MTHQLARASSHMRHRLNAWQGWEAIRTHTHTNPSSIRRVFASRDEQGATGLKKKETRNTNTSGSLQLFILCSTAALRKVRPTVATDARISQPMRGLECWYLAEATKFITIREGDCRNLADQLLHVLLAGLHEKRCLFWFNCASMC